MTFKMVLICLFLTLLASCGGKDKDSNSGVLQFKGAAASSKIFPIRDSKSIGAGTPASFKLLVTKVWLGENADCSDATLVDDRSDNPEYLDFIQNPTVLAGSILPGSYNCMIYQMYDTILFTTPASITNPGTHSGCTANTTYGMDIFRDPGEVWYNYDNGTTQAASGDMSDSNALQTLTDIDSYAGRQLTTTFFSTGPAADIKAAFPDFHQDGTDYYQYGELNAPIVIAKGQTKTITMTWDFTNQLSGDNMDGADPLCWVEGPEMTLE